MGVFRREEKRAVPLPYGGIRAITASAQRLGKNQITSLSAPTAYHEWQREAWVGYDRIGEVHYGFNVVANTLSRIRVYAAAITTSDEVPVPLKQDEKNQYVESELARKANDLMYDLTTTDFTSLIRAFALNMAVPGECLLVDIKAKEDSPPKWAIKSVDEIKVEDTKISLVPRADAANSMGADKGVRVLSTKKGGKWDRDVPIGRIWRQHPRFSAEPDSSMRAISDPVEELLLLQRLVRATTRARLNNGMLFMPDSIQAQNAMNAPGGVVADEIGGPVEESAVEDSGTTLLAELIDSVMTPISEEGAPSEVVPLLLTGPGEAGQQIRYITMDRASDQWLVERAERALDRILQGIDIPKEIVTGLKDVKYANAVAINEDFWKSNIEPLALVFVDALTEIFLRPSLIAAGFDREDVNRVAVWYDPSEIVTRPNHAEDATEGYDRSLLSGSTWRREHGFSDLDAPNEAELAMQLLLSKGSIPEDVMATLLQTALPKLLGKQREDNIKNRDIPFPDAAAEVLGGPPEDTGTPTQEASAAA